MNYLLVFLGGGVGSLCRFGISQLLQRSAFNFPWATLLANALSCIVFGVVAELLLRGSINPQYRFLLLTGFCGGFSTFSTFTNETWLLLYNGQIFLALANILLSLFVCLICLYLGMKMV
ncbi:MAG: fluoride efflux transporter CrcB [Saprospiraceae bacterium]